MPATPPAPKPVPAELPSVVAKVNGDDIQRGEFETTIQNVESRAGRPVPPEQRDQVYRGVLEDLIALRLLKQEVARRQLTATDAELAEAMKGMRQQFPTEAAFKQALIAQKMTLEQLREETRTQVLVSKMLQQEVGSQIAVKPTDISGFYEKNPDKFQQPEAVHASHVLITVPEGAAPAARAAARAKAENVLKQARAGVDFAKLARTYSDDASKGRGGDLGFFPKGQMVPAFEAAAFALAPNQVSDLVESPFGFHVIKVIEKRPGPERPVLRGRATNRAVLATGTAAGEDEGVRRSAAREGQRPGAHLARTVWCTPECGGLSRGEWDVDQQRVDGRPLLSSPGLHELHGSRGRTPARRSTAGRVARRGLPVSHALGSQARV